MALSFPTRLSTCSHHSWCGLGVGAGIQSQTYGRQLFQFQADAVDEYLAYISKYRSWSAQAMENGDAFTKEIGKAKSVPGISLKFTFHSGNASNHFLEISVCSLGNCSVFDPMYLDTQGAEELGSLLKKLKSGELLGEDVGDKYT